MFEAGAGFDGGSASAAPVGATDPSQRAVTPDSYRQFFADAGYQDVRLTLCEGRVPCAVAVIQKPQ